MILNIPLNTLILNNLAQAFSNILGISLLQQRTPEFIALSGVDEHQLPIFDGQSVVYYDIYPVAKLPELQDSRDSFMFPFLLKEALKIECDLIQSGVYMCHHI